LERVAAAPSFDAATSRGRHRGVVPRDAGDGRWSHHVHAVREPAPDIDTDAIVFAVPVSAAVRLAIAVRAIVRLLVAVSS
jgi:hypothetical protein